MQDLNRGYHPPSNTNPLKQKAAEAAKKKKPHQAVAHVNSLDSVGDRSHYLSFLFLEIFGHGHDRFGPENFHGKICGIKNRAKELTDSPYEWVIVKLFRIKGSEEFDPRSDEEAENLPTRVHKYLSSVVAQEKDSVPEPEEGDKLSQEEVENLVENGYSEDQFARFKRTDNPSEKALIYKP